MTGASGDWTDLGSNVWSRALTTEPQNIIFDDTVFVYKLSVYYNATPFEKYAYYWDTNVFKVYSVGNPTAYYSSIEAAQRTSAVEMTNYDYLTFNNIVGKLTNGDIWTASGTMGLTMNNCEGHYSRGFSTANALTTHNTSTSIINGGKYTNVAICVAHGGTQTNLTSELNGVEMSDCNNGYAPGGVGVHTLNRCYIHDTSGIAIKNAGLPGSTNINYSIMENIGNYGIYQNSSGVTNINNSIFYDTGGTSVVITSSRTINMHNTVVYRLTSRNLQKDAGASYTADNNLFWRDTDGDSTMFDGVSYNRDNFSSYQSASSPQDANSLSVDPSFTNASTSYSTATDFQLFYLSPAIDSGTDVSLTTDYAGNPIYGTPDIGAYEYQPPYTIASNEIDIAGDVRIYADGKFRNTVTAGGTTADLSVTPDGGFGTGDYSEWMNIDIDTWDTTGDYDYSKKWTETSDTIGSSTTTHTVGDLNSNTNYNVYYTKNGGDKTYLARTISNSSGQITFDYDQGYSSVEFEISLFVGSSANRPPAAPTDVTLSINSDNQVEITWTDPTDSNLNRIEILRSKSWLPVSSTIYDTVQTGVETYTDTDVLIGETIKYVLIAKDGNGGKSIDYEYSITVTDNSPTTTTATTTTTTTTTGPILVTPTSTQTQTRYQQAGVSETEVDSTVSSFSDIDKESWHAPFIARLHKLSVLDGYPDGTIKPDNTINRAEIAKIATKSFDLTEAAETFSDVPDNAWYAPFIGALQSIGAVWTTTTNYRPAESVTRGEALWTLLTATGIDLTTITPEKLFPDVNTHHRFAPAITYAAQNEVISGYENGNFGPGDTLTRAQVAKIVTLIKGL